MAAQTCCGTCFCFRDVQKAIVAIGMLTGVCSFVQILVTIAVFTGMEKVDLSNGSAEATTYCLYVALACLDFVMIVLSFLLVYGNEGSIGISRCYTLPWLILLPFYFIYETGINIYYFYHQLTPGSYYKGPLEGGSYVGFAAVPLVYWITKAILYFTSFVYLVIRMQHSSSTSNVRYVRQVESFHEYESAPRFPHPAPMISLPAAPSITRPSPMMSAPQCNSCGGGCASGRCKKSSFPYPSPMMSLPSSPPMPRPSPMMAAPQCTSCSGGCSADRCNKCNLPQPLYGYAGTQVGNGGMPVRSAIMQGENSGMQARNVGMQFGNAGMQFGNAGMQAGNNAGAVQSKGWTTSVYNAGQ